MHVLQTGDTFHNPYSISAAADPISAAVQCLVLLRYHVDSAVKLIGR